MSRIMYIVVLVMILLISCSRGTIGEKRDCACGEEEVWNLILKQPDLKRIYTNGNLLIDNAYSEDNSRRAYGDFFTCRFYEQIIEPNRDDSLSSIYSHNLWDYGRELRKVRNIRYPINFTEKYSIPKNVYFVNIDSLSIVKNSTQKLYGTTVFPFGYPKFCKGKTSIILDDNSHGAWILSIDLDNCKMTKNEYYWYPNYGFDCGITGGDHDWVDLIDFNMSLDSFYQFQYDEVLIKLDSLNRNSYNKDLDQFKEK